MNIAMKKNKGDNECDIYDESDRYISKRKKNKSKTEVNPNKVRFDPNNIKGEDTEENAKGETKQMIKSLFK